MLPNLSQTVVSDRPEKPARRTRRVLSACTTARLEKLRTNLTEPAVVAEDLDLLNSRVRDLFFAFKPRNGWQDWLTATIATIMVRLDRCDRIERKLRDLASYRAIDFWEDDQALEVETLASKLERDPLRVVAKLRQSPAGIDWLLKRWRILADVEPRAWTVEQRALAGRLVGGHSEVDPTRPGFASDRVLELEAGIARVEEADAILRGLVEADLSDDSVPGLAKLRRYARSLHRQMKWYVDQFQVKYPSHARDDLTSQPNFFGMALNLNEPQAPAPSFAPLEPEIDETNPFSPEAAEPENDETKPFLPEAAKPRNDETKPIGRVELSANLAEAVTQVVAEEEVATEFDDCDSRRKRRVNPEQEVARRRKAARRREALACGSGC